MKSLYLQCLKFSIHLMDASEMKLVKQVHKHTPLYKREKVIYSATVSYVFIGLTLLKRGGQNNEVMLWIPCGYKNSMSYLPANTTKKYNLQYRGPTILG